MLGTCEFVDPAMRLNFLIGFVVIICDPYILLLVTRPHFGSGYLFHSTNRWRFFYFFLSILSGLK